MGPTVRTQKPPTLGPRRGLVVLAGAVFILGLGFVPYPLAWASHVSWSTIAVVNDDGLSSRNDLDMVWLSGDTFLYVRTEAVLNDEDVRAAFCTSVSCVAETEVFTSSGIGTSNKDFSVGRIDSNSAIACGFTTNGQVRVSKFDLSVGGWSSPKVAVSGSDVDETCSAFAATATVYVAVGAHSANGVLCGKSINSGETWSACGATVDTDLARASIAGAGKDANNWVIIHGDEGGSLGPLDSCRTTDGGASFTCQNLAASLDADDTDIAYVSGSTYIACHVDGGTGSLVFWRTNDDGATWFQNTVTTLTNMGGCSVSALDSSTVAVATASNVVTPAFPTGHVCTSASGGATGSWTCDIAYTHDTAGYSAAVGGHPSAGVAVSATGRVYAGFSVQEESGADDDFENAFVFGDLFAPAAPTGATATAAVVGLVGFDVDRTGTTVIARTGSGGGDTDVKTFSGLDLALLGTVATGCDRADGVSALKNHVLFVDCFTATPVDGCDTTGVGTDVSCIRIRSASLGVPVYDPNCDGCPQNFGMSGGEGSFSDFPDAISLGKMEVFPYDLGVFENTNTPASSCVECTHAIFSLGFSTTTGRLGVLTLQYREGEGLGEGDIRRDEVGTLGSSTPNDFCSAFDGTRDYVGGALTGVPSRALNVDYSEPFEPDAVVVPVLTQRFVASGTVSGGSTFDCGTDRIVTIASTGQLYVLFASNGTVVNTFPSAGITIGSSCGGRAATISGNGDFIAWCDNSILKLAHADNGTPLTTTFSAPTGTFKEMKFTFAGQTLFATSTTQIATYAVGGVVTGVQVESEEGEGAPPPPPAPGGLLGDSASGIAAAFEISSFGANLFMGALLIGLVSVGVGTGGGSLLEGERFLRGWSWPAALVGAIIGFLAAWGFGFFDTKVVFAVVVLCATILSVWFIRGRG